MGRPHDEAVRFEISLPPPRPSTEETTEQRFPTPFPGPLLVVFYYPLNNEHLQYRELGGNYFDTLDPIRLRRHLVKRLESLGYEVTLAERKAA